MLCTKFLFQSLLWSLDQKQRRRNFKVQRSNAVLATQKSAFRKRIGPLRNGRESIFVTILLPEFISDQAVRFAFSNFREVVSVFKGRHKFNRSIRNGERHVRIFPAGGDPVILPRKISLHGNIHPEEFPFRGKGGVVQQVKNSHQTHSKRFQYIFH